MKYVYIDAFNTDTYKIIIKIKNNKTYKYNTRIY